ncbi:phenylacetic acid degradation operon negative regulatory protein PaaX [Azospirillum doebereinerae]|uniref:phenylacetic acid degradation operon negative regulatory protein PaaX n=1 Tax=Azospirillum doebereinerae TaxID=92933 RepID=UPI001EE4EF00|nr:phenylacetic acid degradation operon negative regulatory protein PaaX [Azospirillum doebereinerae]MCG5242047.1 phenylacetic acid degradation operon negative regulatory protein PaaX [Azospirillum doebereinerae]
MARPRRLDDLAAQLTEAVAPRAKSLIITVYGDAVLPHGGSAWLGGLIDLMAHFGMSERIVRTSVFRLCKDDWLANTQIGRRSFYRATDSGKERFAAAGRRIYAPLTREWDRGWDLLMVPPNALDGETRDSLKRELLWQGFGAASATVYAHPNCDEAAMHRLLAALGVADKVVHMKATLDRAGGFGALRDLVRGCWDVDQLEHDYAAFLDRFRPVWAALDVREVPDPRIAFVIRTLMIHDFRRILLRDPMLPPDLLPADWPGQESRMLTRNLYRRLAGPSESYLMSALTTANGPLPEADPAFATRFGGLADSEAFAGAL